MILQYPRLPLWAGLSINMLWEMDQILESQTILSHYKKKNIPSIKGLSIKKTVLSIKQK